MTAGVVIAGGRSTRFGERDKAVAPLAGTPMIRRIVGRISDHVDELVINCRAEQVDAIRTALDGLSPTFARDEAPDEGPVAGIATGLDATNAEYAFVVACDMPFIDPAFVDYLFERAQEYDAAIPRSNEWFQTTHAVYRTDAMATACEYALERGNHKVVEALSDIDYVVVERDEITTQISMEMFENLNTRAEFEAAEERF